jgi:hypothetical protein
MLNHMVAGLVALSLGSAAAAKGVRNCLSEVEGTAVFSAMLPDLIDGLRDKCAAHLPADAFLATNGEALIARYKVAADQRWPVAKQAFGRIAGQEEMTDKLPDEYFRPMLGAMVGAELVKDIKPADCGSANRIVENLSPLPAENVAALIGAILVLADDGKGKESLPMCKA